MSHVSVFTSHDFKIILIKCSNLDVKKDILWRVYLCFLCIIVLGVVVLGRAFYIQRIQGSYWTNMSDSLHLKYLPINAERGSIYSEDGNLLSTSIPVYDIYIDFGAAGLREKKVRDFITILIHSAFH